jgi:hypothetical protein
MRKEIVEHRTTAGRSPGNAEWLDLDSIAHVQLTSDDPACCLSHSLTYSFHAKCRDPEATRCCLDNVTRCEFNGHLRTSVYERGRPTAVRRKALMRC